MAGSSFEKVIGEAYGFEEPAIEFGAAFRDESTHPGCRVRMPIRMANRHGLVAGATGTGKTKTLQVLTEQFSDAGVPVFLVRHQGRHLRPRRPRAAGRPGEVPDPAGRA